MMLFWIGLGAGLLPLVLLLAAAFVRAYRTTTASGGPANSIQRVPENVTLVKNGHAH